MLPMAKQVIRADASSHSGAAAAAPVLLPLVLLPAAHGSLDSDVNIPMTRAPRPHNSREQPTQNITRRGLLPAGWLAAVL